MSNHLENQKINNDTIAAIATPLGSGGIHVVRLSGHDARRIADTVFVGKTRLCEAQSHTAHYGRIVETDTGRILDDVIALVMWEPKSYTCEDTVEFSTHGSPYVSAKLLELLLENGARLAEPGEFTLRAFLNGRIDLSQAEAVADLVAARTESSHEVAISQIEGNLSKLINKLRDSLLGALSLLDAYTDFPEEEIESAHLKQVTISIEKAQGTIRKLLFSFETGRLLKNGLVVPIIGPPNSGKSSLFNYLLDHDRAIVTSVPGTTRDTISECVNIGGLPVELIDTAGIHHATDLVELEGIKRSRKEIEHADLVVGLVDGATPDTADAINSMGKMAETKRIVSVINKIDLMEKDRVASLKSSLKNDTLYISALTGAGIDELKRTILKSAFPDGRLPDKDEARISNIRHKRALEMADNQLNTALDSLAESRSHEFVAFDLRLAIRYIEEIIGKVTPDDVLNRIFSNFCIGK